MLKIEELREIIEIIDESSIHEFTYETEKAKIVLKKPKINKVEMIPETTQAQMSQNVAVSSEENLPPITDNVSKQKERSATDSQVNFDYEIVSPMVGTLYSAPSPESEPYVTVGSRVTKDSIVCIVEAMKLFNEIEAEVNGEIVEVLVENGELVEYGQPLYRVKKI